jgi:hypothetical protein
LLSDSRAGFAIEGEKPLRRLNLDFEHGRDTGRDINL